VIYLCYTLLNCALRLYYLFELCYTAKEAIRDLGPNKYINGKLCMYFLIYYIYIPKITCSNLYMYAVIELKFYCSSEMQDKQAIQHIWTVACHDVTLTFWFIYTFVLFINLFLQNAGQAGYKTYMNRGMYDVTVTLWFIYTWVLFINLFLQNAGQAGYKTYFGRS